MANLKTGFCAMGFLFLLSACQTTSVTSQQTALSAADGEGYILTPIAEASLADGDCGMLLWAREGDQTMPVFKYLIKKNVANVSFNGTPAQLTRTNVSGLSNFGVAEKQTFVDETGAIQLAVNVHFGLNFDSGSYLEDGLITVEDNEGWRTVTPVAGITGCRRR